MLTVLPFVGTNFLLCSCIITMTPRSRCLTIYINMGCKNLHAHMTYTVNFLVEVEILPSWKGGKLRLPVACWCEPQSFSCLPSSTHPCHSAMDWSAGRPVVLHPSPEDWCSMTSPEPACHPPLSLCLPISTGIHSSVCHVRRRTLANRSPRVRTVLFSNWLIIAPHVQYSSDDALSWSTDYSVLYGGRNV